LVGHSLGGYTVRVFAHDYADEVSGLVLVDAQDLPPADGAAPHPAPKPGGPSLPALLARVGLTRLMSGSLGGISNLPPAEKQANLSFGVTPRFSQTFLDEGRGMSEGGAQASAVTTLGSLPLIVLTAGKDPDAKHMAAQTALLQLSTNSQQIFADKSGHYIMVDQPDLAIAAVVNMVQQVQKK
jgi:pimeloyl-ACP methyl ester carboxylesterase